MKTTGIKFLYFALKEDNFLYSRHVNIRGWKIKLLCPTLLLSSFPLGPLAAFSKESRQSGGGGFKNENGGRWGIIWGFLGPPRRYLPNSLQVRYCSQF